MKIIKPEVILKTPNYILEPILASHATSLFKDLQDIRLYTYIPTNPPVSISELEDKFSIWAKRQSENQSEIWINYAIYDYTNKEYVGTLQATILSPFKALIAYEIFPDRWRKGIGKETCLALLYFLFNEYKLDEVIAYIDTRNIASIKLVESLGFKRTEFINKADYFKGEFSDEYIYKIDSDCFFEIIKK